MKILYLHDAGFTPGLQGVLKEYAKKAQLDWQPFEFANLTHGMATQPTKTKLMANPLRRNEFFSRLTQAIASLQPKLIVINDWVALEYITTTYRSLDTTRGGVYFVNGIPAIVLDSFRTTGGGSKIKAVPHLGWLMLQDLKKLKRWFSGTQRREPVFDYETVDTRERFKSFVSAFRSSVCIGMDIETSGRGTGCIITCSGYALLQRDGRILSRTVPFMDPTAPNGAHWTVAEFHYILTELAALHRLPIPKVMQNGTYDAHHYVRYRMPPSHYLFDTANAFHALWPEAPKRLDFISSIAWDHYRFWKDENKADEKDDNQTDRVPNTTDGWFRYLRYCGLDCHYTLGSAVYLFSILAAVPWAMENFRQSFRQSIGPGLAMSLRGVRVNKEIQTGFEYHNIAEAEKAKRDMAIMTPGLDFNPNSPAQVANLIYDICRAQPLPKRAKNRPVKREKKPSDENRSTNEKDLEVITTQHPLLDVLINQIWDCKKPANNASKYGRNGLQLLNDRWMYKLSPIGTETGRYACKASDFWVGTQIQNVPYEMRPMVEPDPGYILFDFDYSKADFWHTAFASGEPDMIKVASDAELDVHCYHASKFFSKPYDEIYSGYRKKEPWVVDSLHGVRQNAKRIVYGANYLMGGYTLFITMGKQAVDATAIAMGRNIANWSIKDYSLFCQSLLDFYFERMYPRLLSWLEETVSAVSRRGNLAVCCGGRTRSFFADLITDKGSQRELAAFYGQGGTACTINTVLDNVYYERKDNQDLMLLFQVHDSVVGQVREDKLHLLKDLRKSMMIENKINEHTFTIPAEGAVGYGWGYRMTDWHENITLEEIKKADEKWRSKNTHLLSSSSQDTHELEKIRSLVI